MRRPSSPGLLAGFLAGAGVTHFVQPASYEAIVPERLGHAKELVFWSGVAEIAVAGAVAVSRTRALGAAAAVALFVAVFPANIAMARDGAYPPRVHRAAVARLPLQLPLLVWAWRVAQRAHRDTVASRA